MQYKIKEKLLNFNHFFLLYPKTLCKTFLLVEKSCLIYTWQPYTNRYDCFDMNL